MKLDCEAVDGSGDGRDPPAVTNHPPPPRSSRGMRWWERVGFGALILGLLIVGGISERQQEEIRQEATAVEVRRGIHDEVRRLTDRIGELEARQRVLIDTILYERAALPDPREDDR